LAKKSRMPMIPSIRATGTESRFSFWPVI
jgi:hypothetical protein